MKLQAGQPFQGAALRQGTGHDGRGCRAESELEKPEKLQNDPKK